MGGIGQPVPSHELVAFIQCILYLFAMLAALVSVIPEGWAEDFDGPVDYLTLGIESELHLQAAVAGIRDGHDK